MPCGAGNRCVSRFTAAALLLLGCAAALAAPKRVLYVTATYGFRHTDSIPASIEVFRQIAEESAGALEIVNTEDVSLLNADYLRNFDALYFFTSGELPLSDAQKRDILEFVRSGKGFGGSHSATDCLYTWPEYGDLIGGYFDGHPWVQDAAVDVEDPQSPLTSHAAPLFRFLEEYYQFRAFSRDRVRVLLTLDTRSVNPAAAGVNRDDGDFALAWIRSYGQGRVFYSAFGHFPESFSQQPIRTMLRQALLWLTGQIEADATPRSGPNSPEPAPAAIADLAGTSDAVAPGGIIAVTGARLTSGSNWDSAAVPLPVRLAGTHVEVDGVPAPLFSVRPDRLLIQLPASLTPGRPAVLTVSSVNRTSAPVPLTVVPAAPAILAATRVSGALVIYATGLGQTTPAIDAGTPAPLSPLSRTTEYPTVLLDGQPITPFFAGLAPGYTGLYQLNAAIPPSAAASFEIRLQSAGRTSPAAQASGPATNSATNSR